MTPLPKALRSKLEYPKRTYQPLTCAAHAALASVRFRSPDDIDHYEKLLKQGAELIASHLAPLELMLVDTKFEFGYANDSAGDEQLVYMDRWGP